MPETPIPASIADRPPQEIITFFQSLPDDVFFSVPFEILQTLPREAQEAIVLDARDRRERLESVLQVRNQATGIGVGTPEEIEAARLRSQALTPSGNGNYVPQGQIPMAPTAPPPAAQPALPPGGSIEQAPLRPPGPQAMADPQTMRLIQALRRA